MAVVWMEILPILRPTAFTGKVIRPVRCLITSITESLPFVAAAHRIFRVRTVHMVKYHVRNHLYAVRVHYGYHTQHVVLGPETGSNGTFLVFVAEVVMVERRIPYRVRTGIFIKRRHPHGVYIHFVQTRGKFRKIIRV